MRGFPLGLPQSARVVLNAAGSWLSTSPLATGCTAGAPAAVGCEPTSGDGKRKDQVLAVSGFTFIRFAIS